MVVWCENPVGREFVIIFSMTVKLKQRSLRICHAATHYLITQTISCISRPIQLFTSETQFLHYNRYFTHRTSRRACYCLVLQDLQQLHQEPHQDGGDPDSEAGHCMYPDLYFVSLSFSIYQGIEIYHSRRLFVPLLLIYCTRGTFGLGSGWKLPSSTLHFNTTRSVQSASPPTHHQD